MKYIQTKLNGGGKLHYVKNKINKATYVDVLFNCGARCDTTPGLAHFVEHMFFTGTKSLSKDDVWQKYWSFILTNAYTNLREIAFTGTIFTNELKDYLATVATLINESTFTQAAVEKERKIINQEIVGCEDKHEDIAHVMNLYNLYALPAFKEKTFCGSIATISKITSRDVKKFVQKYFVANNLEIYICSPLSLRKIKQIINKNLADKLPINDNLEDLPIHFYDVENPNFFKTKAVDIPKSYINLNFTFPTDYNDFEFEKKLEMALDIINDSSVGMLKQLRIKKDLVYDAYFAYWKMKDNSSLVFRCNCEPNNVNDVIKTLAEYLNSILTEGFSAEQLNLVKRKNKHREMRRLPSISRLVNTLYDFRWYGKILDYKKFKKIKANATVEDCNAVIKQALSGSQPSLTLYGGFNKQTLISKAEFNKLFDFKNN